jgi:hypothetical protein
MQLKIIPRIIMNVALAFLRVNALLIVTRLLDKLYAHKDMPN